MLHAATTSPAPPKKVLIVVPHYPPKQIGGTELHARKVASWLISRGCTVQVVCVEGVEAGDADSLAAEQDTFENALVHRLQLTHSASATAFRYSYDNPHIEDYLDNLVSDWQPDVIHLMSGYLVTACVVRAARRHRTPVVVTLNDYWFICPRINLIRSDGQPCGGPHHTLDCSRCLLSESRRYRLPEQLLPGMADIAWSLLSRLDFLKDRVPLYQEVACRERLLVGLLNQADGITIPTNSLRPRMIRAGVRDRFCLSRHGIVREQLGIRHDAAKSESPLLRFGYMGNVLYSKGVDLLVDAYRQLANEYSNASLEIRGDTCCQPGYAASLERRLAETPKASMRGRYQPSQVGPLLQDIDILVVPSRWPEIGPLTILEAFAAKTPVIAARLGNMPELIDHEQNGLLFEPGSVSDLAKQMRRLLGEPSLRARLIAGIPPVRRPDDEMMEVVRLYARVLRAPPCNDYRSSAEPE